MLDRVEEGGEWGGGGLFVRFAFFFAPPVHFRYNRVGVYGVTQDVHNWEMSNNSLNKI